MIAATTAITTSLVGLVSLRRAWQRDVAMKALWMVGGWLLLALSLLCFSLWLGGEVGIPVALVFVSTAALCLVATNVKWREARGPRRRTGVIDPSDRKSRVWRGVVRTLLAGPLSGLAAIGVGVALAARLPLQEIDRVAMGGLAVPLIWAGGMAWTLADDKIIRASLVLIAVSAISYAIAFLPV